MAGLSNILTPEAVTEVLTVRVRVTFLSLKSPVSHHVAERGGGVDRPQGKMITGFAVTVRPGERVREKQKQRMSLMGT